MASSRTAPPGGRRPRSPRAAAAIAAASTGTKKAKTITLTVPAFNQLADYAHHHRMDESAVIEMLILYLPRYKTVMSHPGRLGVLAGMPVPAESVDPAGPATETPETSARGAA